MDFRFFLVTIFRFIFNLNSSCNIYLQGEVSLEFLDGHKFGEYHIYDLLTGTYRSLQHLTSFL